MEQSGTNQGGGLRKAIFGLLAVITAILVVWALRATGSFLVPITFSLFLVLLMAPIDRWVAERVPSAISWLGHVTAMTTILAVLLGFMAALWVSAHQILQKYPAPSQTSPEAIFGMQESARAGSGSSASNSLISEVPGLVKEMLGGAGIDLSGRLVEWFSVQAVHVLQSTGIALASLIVVFFLTLIMLIEAPSWRSKLALVLNPTATEEAVSSVEMIERKLQRYLLARTVLGILTAILYAGWLWVFGIDLLVVWALLAFLLNFIPTFGSIIIGVLAAGYAYVETDPGTALTVAAGLFMIEQVMGNYVDPRVQGRTVSLSPAVVFTALLLWAWIWGIAGAILAVPITISIAIICAHVERLQCVAVLLGSDPADNEGM